MTRKYLWKVFHELVMEKKSNVLGGHVVADHVRYVSTVDKDEE